jgi:hypothetical protein
VAKRHLLLDANQGKAALQRRVAASKTRALAPERSLTPIFSIFYP